MNIPPHITGKQTILFDLRPSIEKIKQYWYKFQEKSQKNINEEQFQKVTVERQN